MKYIALVCLILISLLVAIISFNVVLIPRGLHLTYFVAGGGDNDALSRSWMNSMVSKTLSEFIFKTFGNYCDAPYYRSGELLPGENMTIDVIVNLASTHPERREAVLLELSEALEHCDPNMRSSEQFLTPIQGAVLFGDIGIVKMLLDGGALSDGLIDFPSSPFHGRTTVELSQHLANKYVDQSGGERYREIFCLLVPGDC